MYPSITDILTSKYKAFMLVESESNINMDNKCINSPTDYAVMQNVHGSKFLFQLKDSVTMRPPKSKNKSLPMSEACFIRLNNGVEWINSPSWVDAIGTKLSLKLVDSVNRCIIATNDETFEVASWITDDELNTLGQGLVNKYKYDIKVHEGFMVSYSINWG